MVLSGLYVINIYIYKYIYIYHPGFLFFVTFYHTAVLIRGVNVH